MADGEDNRLLQGIFQSIDSHLVETWSAYLNVSPCSREPASRLRQISVKMIELSDKGPKFGKALMEEAMDIVQLKTARVRTAESCR